MEMDFILLRILNKQKMVILTVKRRGEGSPIVSVFKVDEEKLNQLNILRFDGPNVEWLRYVSSNRKV